MSKRFSGTVFSIIRHKSSVAVGIVTNTGDIAVYCVEGPLLPPLADMLNLSPLFRVHVAEDDLSSGRWGVLGKLRLRPDQLERTAYAQRPVGSSEIYSLKGVEMKTIELSEALTMEPSGGWRAQQVEERIVDSLEGRANEFLGRLRRHLRLDSGRGT